MSIKIALIGATGIVGYEFLKLLEKSKIQIKKLKLIASQKSIGKKIFFRDNYYSIETFNINDFKDIDFAILSAGSKTSKQIAPSLQNLKVVCIDLSSAYRMDEKVPLIIPEINAHALSCHNNLIASPNCTTTMILMALHQLHKKLKIKRFYATTYQAASGGGKKLIDKLLLDTKNTLAQVKGNHSYGFNLYLHDSPLNKNKYNEEETKIINETHKILEDKKIKINATCVRVPVLRAHSIALNIELTKKFNIEDIYKILKKSKNIKIFEDYKNNRFVTPQDVIKKNEVFVSRIRKDISNPSAIDIWICSDQLLKGAALNAFQILEALV